MPLSKEFAEVYPVPVDGLNAPAQIIVPVSFEAGEQAQNRVYTAGKIRIKRVRGIVTKALAITDAGTITVQNAVGNTIATLSFAASAALNTEVDSGVITNINRDIAADSHFRLLTAKPTAGGNVLVSVEYNILPLR